MPASLLISVMISGHSQFDKTIKIRALKELVVFQFPGNGRNRLWAVIVSRVDFGLRRQFFYPLQAAVKICNITAGKVSSTAAGDEQGIAGDECQAGDASRGVRGRTITLSTFKNITNAL